MNRNRLKVIRRVRRKAGIRKHTFGGPDKPRLTVFRSAKHIYAQLIDDLAGVTVASASSAEKEGHIDAGGNCVAAKAIGERLAKRASEAGITNIVFDRNGYKYHGRIKALAEAAREGGLKF